METPHNGSREIPGPSGADEAADRKREVQGRVPEMNGPGKSDSLVVPVKSPNKAGKPAAEVAEGRRLAKGNPHEQNTLRMQGRERVQSALERVREAAGREGGQQLTALLHHVYNIDTLREAYYSVRKDAAAGVDGETWEHYGKDLEVNLQD